MIIIFKIKGSPPFKLSFIAHSTSKFFTTDDIDNGNLNCSYRKFISNNIFSVSPINGINNKSKLATIQFGKQDVKNKKTKHFF